jgi:bacteriorhodopsin
MQNTADKLNPTEAADSAPPEPRPEWHLLYFVLAAFGCITTISLQANSDGPEKGAVFALELPIRQKESNS